MVSNFGIKNILLFIFFFCLFIPNIIIYINRVQVMNNGLETTAIVTSTHSGTRGLYPRAYVTYTIDGVKYGRTLHRSYKSVNPGDEIAILYHANNPKKITSKDRKHATDNTKVLIVSSVVPILGMILYLYLGIHNVIEANAK